MIKRNSCTVVLVKIETCAKKAILPLRTSLELLTNQYAMPNPHTCSDWLESNWIYTWCAGPKEQKQYKLPTSYQILFLFLYQGSLYIYCNEKVKYLPPTKSSGFYKGRGNKVKINSNKNPWYRVSAWAPDIFY